MEKEITLGAIVYYGTWGHVCKGIYCGHPIDEAFSIVFPLYPERLVLDAKTDRGDANVPHEFFACTLVRNDDLCLDPQELIAQETARIRGNMEIQLDTMNKKQEAHGRDI
jgi:hypothetical protein